MKTLFRILGTAAAVAVTGAAIVALDKILNQKDPLHVEEVEFPEDAELDPKEAEKAAEAYAEGEAKAADEANAEAAAAETPEAAAEPAAQPAEEAAARQHPQRAARSRCATRRHPTRTRWKQAPPWRPKTRAENLTPPRSPKPVTLATGKNRAAKAES